jgi:hypothetical protein
VGFRVYGYSLGGGGYDFTIVLMRAEKLANSLEGMQILRCTANVKKWNPLFRTAQISKILRDCAKRRNSFFCF